MLKDVANEIFKNNYDGFNPLGVIIKNVNSSVFCAVKRDKKSIENRF